MKAIFTILIVLLAFGPVAAQNDNPNYDAELAEKLGADEYGMKMYVMVILKSGANTTATKEEKDSLFAGHMSNMGRLVESGDLIVAGPFGKNDHDFRGIFIFDVRTVEEAQPLVDSDPAIKADLLKAEMFPWYGSAALRQYLEDSDKVWKVNH